MPNLIVNCILVVGVSFLLGLAATYIVRRLAWRYDLVASASADRWHKNPTAMMGGVAIYLATIAAFLLFIPITHDSLVVVGGSSLLFLVGLVDDIVIIKPYQKLIGQLIGVAGVIQFGLKLPLTGNEVVDIWLTAFWIVGITNAINLLDNMDGLAAGTAAIAAIFLGLSFAGGGQVNELLLVATFVGALLGFLVFNFNPASIFMGDSGSMFVGFFLATSVLLNQVGGRSRGIFPILAVPVLILFVPIFDTTFVTVLRKLWGRKASQGGRDHTSHRLVALGLSEKGAVLMLYGFAVTAGILSMFVGQLPFSQSLALITFFSIVLIIIGVYLSKVRVYEGESSDLAEQNNAAFAFLIDISHKRRIFEVFLDAFLITLSYYAAYLIVLGSLDDHETESLFLKSLPILILFKLSAFLVVGVYRGLWRYTSVSDFVIYAKGIILGSTLSILALLLIYRFEYFSRAVFIVDALLLLFALIGSRMAFRLLRQAIPAGSAADDRRALIYGAGDGGSMLLREINNNPKLFYRPIGFIDDDPLKLDKVINGVRVYGGSEHLEALITEMNISEVLLSMEDIEAEKLAAAREICRRLDVSLKRSKITIEPVEFE